MRVTRSSVRASPQTMPVQLDSCSRACHHHSDSLPSAAAAACSRCSFRARSRSLAASPLLSSRGRRAASPPDQRQLVGHAHDLVELDRQR
jgi:hypothetical protein